MDFINLSASITMLDLVRYLLQDTNNSFSFYSGKLGGKDHLGNVSQLTSVCQYICQKVRKEWTIHNIGIIADEDGELMLCVTSPDPSMPAEVVTFLVEALAISLTQAKSKSAAVKGPDSDESTEEVISPDLIQVNATMKEIGERIEQFIRYKRSQANINNVLDFCGASDHSQMCARVDAVLVRKKNSTSHLAVCNVLDRYTSKHTSEKLTLDQKPVTNLPVHKEQQTTTPSQKRMCDVASLETMPPDKVKKQ